MSLNYSFVRGYLVDLIGIEPMTSSMPWKRAPSCATGPLGDNLSILADAARQVNTGRIGWLSGTAIHPRAFAPEGVSAAAEPSTNLALRNNVSRHGV
jgi:hypothetical protein